MQLTETEIYEIINALDIHNELLNDSILKEDDYADKNKYIKRMDELKKIIKKLEKKL